ncbi:DUF4241 domain-containing protein [Streptomyces sp. NPDC002574]|uniref:DUF4241 domain-containing protein n=1 Tax=Streptomyces sp. NPDC002574 TaxID=3364652 RepID=UPI0036D00F04
MPLAAPDVQRLFTLGSVYDCGEGRSAEVTRLPQAELPLPSGRVVAQDPFWGFEDEPVPFTVSVKPGTYTVVVSVTEVAWESDVESGHERVAAAWLRTSEEPTVTWELALVDGQDIGELSEEQFFGYGVDAGTGCFVDAAAATALAEFLGEDSVPLEDAMIPDDGDEAPCGPVVLSDPASGHSFVAFWSGWGDGAYPTWIGRSLTGEVTGFVTEFLVVPQPGRGQAGA